MNRGNEQIAHDAPWPGKIYDASWLEVIEHCKKDAKISARHVVDVVEAAEMRQHRIHGPVGDVLKVTYYKDVLKVTYYMEDHCKLS